MAISVVQQPSGSATNYTDSASSGIGSIAVTTNASVGSGNTIIALICWNSFTASITSVSDNVNAGNYTSDLSYTGVSNTPSVAIFRHSSISSGVTTVTCTFTANVADPAIYIYEVSGLSNSSPLDGTNAFEQAGVTSATSNSINTTNANDLLVGVACTNQSATGFEATWTGFESANNNYGIEFLVVAATSTYSATFTIAPAGNVATAIAAYKAFAGGGVAPSVAINPRIYFP